MLLLLLLLLPCHHLFAPLLLLLLLLLSCKSMGEGAGLQLNHAWELGPQGCFTVYLAIRGMNITVELAWACMQKNYYRAGPLHILDGLVEDGTKTWQEGERNSTNAGIHVLISCTVFFRETLAHAG